MAPLLLLEGRIMHYHVTTGLILETATRSFAAVNYLLYAFPG